MVYWRKSKCVRSVFLCQLLDIFTGRMTPLNNQGPSLTSINQPIEPRIKPRLPTVAHTTEGLEKK